MSAWEGLRAVEVEPSLYAADFNILGRQIDDLMASGRERVASEFARESGRAVGTGVRGGTA
jgi:hypothetical protein